ncbi:hypothetical protein [Lutibaculum baratangense]|uniref:Uncharacterized protein n=1 Tax=Lutibaculum baratangense AMV1 TaxID=631454 RepID=V4R8K7_9HYPH|nr:hypothetical protein [Lutibaculum baratangense]ESR22506.1 hypothetical protein N177_4071 [Lutibaculum baratangense AMV1]
MNPSVPTGLALAILALPAHAQSDCEAEAQRAWAEVQESDLAEAAKQQAGTILAQAQDRGQRGQEALCEQALAQVKTTFDLPPAGDALGERPG